MKIFLSIVIPLYNEQKRLNSLTKLYNYLKKKKFKWEVILVNDGSTDKTVYYLKQFVKENHLKGFKLLSYSENKGKGYAIKKGMLKANGQYRLFSDIDLSTPIEELDKFIPFLKKYDVIIGSRKMSGSKVIVHQSPIREKLGKGFTKLSQLILLINIKDFTCGFKCFSKKASENIFRKQIIGGWGFDSEVLYLANKYGYNIKEIPVKWTNDPHSRVKFPKDIITSFMDLLKIRVNDYKKLYN